jgi:hypothetical protein
MTKGQDNKQKAESKSLPTQRSLRQLLRNFLDFRRFGVISDNPRFSIPQIMTFVNTRRGIIILMGIIQNCGGLCLKVCQKGRIDVFRPSNNKSHP